MAHLWRKGEKRIEKRERNVGRVIGGGVSMLRRGASFSSTICYWFCKLDAVFVWSSSHTVGAGRQQQQGAAHPLQTTARCDPSLRLTTNHTVFDDLVNRRLKEFLPSQPGPPLTLATGDGDNKKVEGGGEEGGPEPTWRLKQSRRRKTEARRTRPCSSISISCWRLAWHQSIRRGGAVMNPNCSLFSTLQGVSMQMCPERYLLYARPNV